MLNGCGTVILEIKRPAFPKVGGSRICTFFLGLSAMANYPHDKIMQKHMAPIQNKRKPIKLFVSDVDGVLTDAAMYYTEQGDELKKFNTVLREKYKVDVISMNCSEISDYDKIKLLVLTAKLSQETLLSSNIDDFLKFPYLNHPLLLLVSILGEK